MSDAHIDELLAKARSASSIEGALALTLEAIASAPRAPDPYALRALLAVAAKRPGVAAHYFRVAYARGHRSVETRMGLATCWRVAGDEKGGDAIARGHSLPRILEPFAKAAALSAVEVRRALEGPIPPLDTPAWHGDDFEKVGVSSPRPAPDTLPPRGRPLSNAPKPAPTPAPKPAPKLVPRGTPKAPHPQPLGTLIDIQETDRPAWLEVAEDFSRKEAYLRPHWLEETAQEHPRGGRDWGPVDRLQLAMDPGLPTTRVVSPVTNRMVPVSTLQNLRSGAAMGDFEPHRDVLEARHLILPWVESLLHLAIELPGPVVTEPGKPAKTLCERVILGLTDQELLLLDANNQRNPPARVALSNLVEMTAVAEGFQVSLTLREGKQVHLDLRALQREASRVADSAIHKIADALRACP